MKNKLKAFHGHLKKHIKLFRLRATCRAQHFSVRVWLTLCDSAHHGRNNTATIIDDMMNLELILGASVVAGRCDYFNAAINHARSMAVGHVERDGFVHHLVVFNKVTGKRVTTLTGQVSCE